MSLERELAALGAALEVPDAPDLVPRVRAEIARPRPRWQLARRRLALAVALAALALVAAMLAIPEARSALFRVLNIGSERIVRVDELPAIEAQPRGIGLELGERVTLAQAKARAGFELRELPDEPPPDRVWLGPRQTVWFLWGTPRRVRLLLAQTPELSIGSPPILEKLVAGGTQVEPISVGGRPGWFLSGSPHLVFFLDENGEPVEEVAWLAENVLVWEDDGVTYRLEGSFDAEEAVELATSLR